MNKRLNPTARKAQILDVALQEACKSGLVRITREAIAERTGVSPGLVSHYLGSMTQLRRTLMREAIKRELLPIIAEGLATRNPLATKAPDDLKRKALATL